MTFFDRIKETSTSTGTGTFTLSGAAIGYKAFTNGTYKYCIVNSTETEWEVGEGTVASGVLTRTTIEASSNAGSAVNFSAGTKYVFNTVSAAYVNSLVPYTGASSNVNLGEFGLTAGQLTLDTSPTGTAVVGTTQWNDTIGSSQTLLKGGNVLLKNGVDLVARVVNKVSPATTLTKAAYKAVRVSGAQGQRLAIAYAQANNDNNSADTIGLVCETIAANQEGFIITVGQLLDVNTTGSLQGETWADGDVLYLSPTTAGNLTNIKPNGSTGHIVVIGYVEYANSVHGSIYVKIMNGWELDELHNCYINAPANNEVLTYESSTSLWKNKSIATALGYTPADDSLVMHLAGTETATGVKTFSIGLKTTTGDNFMNTSSGNLLVGHAATPATNTYKLNVNGTAILNNSVIAQTVSSVNVLDIGSIRIADDGNGRYIQGYNGLTIKNSNVTYPNNYLQIGNDVVLVRSNGFINLAATGATSGIQLSTNNNPSITTLKFQKQRNDGVKSAIICSEDFTVATATPIHLYIYGGQETTASNMANLILQHDGTLDRGIVGIGTASPNTSAKLQVDSTSKGVLLPRMTTAQKNAISTPATSLLLYDTDLATFQYYSGSAWTSLGGGGGISGSGTAGQVTYWSGTSAVTGSATLTYTPTTALLVNNSVTASSAIARGLNFTPTLTAAANNDVLVGLDVNATTTIASYTGTNSYGIRINGSNLSNSGTSGLLGKVLLYAESNAQSRIIISSTATGSSFNAGFELNQGTTRKWALASYGTNADFTFYNTSLNKDAFFIAGTTNNLLINSNTDNGYRLDVNGTGATAGALRVTGGNSLLAQTTLSSTSTQLTLDYPGQSLTTLAVGSTGNFTINPKATGTNLYFGTTGSTSGWAFGGTDIRGLLTIQKSVSTTYTLNTDPADPGRVFVMQNNSTTNAANEFSNITMQINSTGSLSGGRILGDIRFIRKTINQSDAFFMISAFKQGATYKDYFKLDFDNSWMSGNLNIGTQSDPTAVLDLSASSTTRASLRIRSGTAPTSPNDGDMWFTGTDLKIQVGGSTKTFTLI